VRELLAPCILTQARAPHRASRGASKDILGHPDRRCLRN
jgi:hypothetical protein